MKTRLATAGAVAILVAATPSAMAAVGQPIRNRTAVVLGWESGSRSNVVVTTTGRVYVIKSLRRYRWGTRVRIRGIKWGRRVRGVKWGYRPRGIRWGIRFASNGTYASRLRVLGRQRTMALRGVVLRRWSRRVAISYRGAVIFLPISPRAVWSSGGTLTNAGTIGTAGSKNAFRVYFTATGAATVTAAKQIAPPVPNRSVPFAGKVTAIDAVDGTITVDATKNPRFPIVLTLTFPESMDLSPYRVKDHVSGLMVRSQTGPEIFVTHISRDNTFVQADDPATNHRAPAPDPVKLQASLQLRSAWEAGKTAGSFTQQGNGLYTGQRSQLRLIDRGLMRNQKTTLLVRKLDGFISAVEDARAVGAPPPPPGPEQIDGAFKASILATARSLRAQIAG